MYTYVFKKKFAFKIKFSMEDGRVRANKKEMLRSRHVRLF